MRLELDGELSSLAPPILGQRNSLAMTTDGPG
jgi:hypothetical protein